MKMEVEVPEDFQGSVVGDLISRRGLVNNTEARENVSTILAEVPLVETFGYATDLRSMTKGQGTFSMELSKYMKVPAAVQQEIIKTRAEEWANRK